VKNEDQRTRLAAAAKKLGLHMPQIQLLLAQERFLFRIASVDENKNLVWKGGSLILRNYTSLKPPRFTGDIDFTVLNLNINQAEELIYEAAKLDLEDGFKFLDIARSSMERDTPYGGERFDIAWEFHGKANSEALRIDLCAGDDVDPKIINMDEVYLLDDDTSLASMAIYPATFIFAEKLETLVRFGTGNTRLKDFIDLWTLIQIPEEELLRDACTKAVQRCFERRDTVLNPIEWNRILSDKDFQELMESARIKNFKKLMIPTVSEMFNSIKTFLNKLGPWNKIET